MLFKEYYLKNILRKERKEFLQFIGVSSPSLVHYLNGRIPKEKTMSKIIEYSKGKIKPNDFYQINIKYKKENNNQLISLSKIGKQLKTSTNVIINSIKLLFPDKNIIDEEYVCINNQEIKLITQNICKTRKQFIKITKFLMIILRFNIINVKNTIDLYKIIDNLEQFFNSNNKKIKDIPQNKYFNLLKNKEEQ